MTIEEYGDALIAAVVSHHPAHGERWTVGGRTAFITEVSAVAEGAAVLAEKVRAEGWYAYRELSTLRAALSWLDGIAEGAAVGPEVRAVLITG